MIARSSRTVAVDFPSLSSPSLYNAKSLDFNAASTLSASACFFHLLMRVSYCFAPFSDEVISRA